MPHFVIDCSENITTLVSPEKVMQAVFDAAVSTAIFDTKDIKVRINPFKYFNTAGSQNDFIHVFGNIMEGRNTDQKSDLSRRIVSVLKSLFPDVPIISMNIRDFEKASYVNKPMV